MGNAAIINPYWDTLGGGERYTSALVSLLLHLGWQVDIKWPKNISADINNRFGLDISAAHFVNNLSTQDYKLAFYVSDGSLPTSLAKKTIIHFQFPFSGVQGASLTNLIKSRFYAFVCNSQFTKSFIDPEFKINSQVIYPPIDTTFFSSGGKIKLILYVGRFSHLTQLKNPQVLISSFKKIYKNLPDWKLIIAGGAGVGTATDMLADLTRQTKGLPIALMLNPSSGQLQKLYSQASIFWSASGYGADERTQPTKVEHFGITPVEGMSAGCVPIITNLGGHKEIVDQGKNGFLWDTPAELEAFTLNICHHPGLMLSLSTAARQKSKIFDISHFNSEFTSLIQS